MKRPSTRSNTPTGKRPLIPNSSAKNIKCKVTENKKLVEVHIAEYKNIISELRTEIDQLKNQGAQPGASEPKLSVSKCGCFKDLQEDNKHMLLIKQEIAESFQERIQLRRALMELDEQNAQNDLEIRKKV